MAQVVRADFGKWRQFGMCFIVLPNCLLHYIINFVGRVGNAGVIAQDKVIVMKGPPEGHFFYVIFKVQFIQTIFVRTRVA